MPKFRARLGDVSFPLVGVDTIGGLFEFAGLSFTAAYRNVYVPGGVWYGAYPDSYVYVQLVWRSGFMGWALLPVDGVGGGYWTRINRQAGPPPPYQSSYVGAPPFEAVPTGFTRVPVPMGDGSPYIEPMGFNGGGVWPQAQPLFTAACVAAMIERVR